MIDTKRIANIKKNTPLDIILLCDQTNLLLLRIEVAPKTTLRLYGPTHTLNQRGSSSVSGSYEEK
jgi:hypothetical protein